MDQEVIKSALDDFEAENFVDAKDKLTGQIKVAKNEYVKAKLGLTGDVMNLPVTSVTPQVNEPEDIDPEVEPDPEPEPPKRTRRSLRRK